MTDASTWLRDERDPSRDVVTSTCEWEGPIFTVDNDELLLQSGADAVKRQVVRHHDAVAIIALRQGADSSQPGGEAEILMVQQYRHPMEAVLWEIPAGLLDIAGEEPVTAAQRELLEETDYQAAQWDVLAEFAASPGFLTESVRIFLARDLSLAPSEERVEREAEEAEFVPTWVPLAQVLRAVQQGRLHNPSTVVAVLALSQAMRGGEAGGGELDSAALRPVDSPWLRSPRSLR